MSPRPENLIIGLIYVPLAALYIMPAIYLSRYATGIKRVVPARQPDDLEATLQAQKSFWKFIGIMTAVIISLYIVVVIVAVLFLTLRSRVTL